MSHRFKRSKPLGRSKPNMKSVGGESLKKSQTAPDSAEIHDFLYVDRTRISALYAQLFPQGILTSVKTTSQNTFSDEEEIGTDIKVLKSEAKTTDTGSEGIEHLFDASWAVPLDVLAALQDRSLVRDTLKGAGLGSIILSECVLRVVDFASMDNLWEPAVKVFHANKQDQSEGSPPPNAWPALIEAMKALPHAIHAHFLTKELPLWGSLQPQSLTIATSDLTLKYGGNISGIWKL